MKPQNFPARKLERQILAKQRNNGEIRRFTENEMSSLNDARNIRTKKSRK